MKNTKNNQENELILFVPFVPQGYFLRGMFFVVN